MAEGFILEYDGQKWLHIEGKMIDKNGNVRHIDSGENIPSQYKNNAYNKKVFEKAVEADNAILNKILENNRNGNGEMSMMDVSQMLHREAGDD